MGRLVTVHDLKEKIDNGEDIMIIDIRDSEDFEDYHIRGAINIPREVLKDNIHTIARDKPVYIYCKYGQKSEAINMMLRQDHHFKKVYSLLGGLYEWAKEFDPSVEVW
jgi:rhodanese-related sulfurtransferase